MDFCKHTKPTKKNNIAIAFYWANKFPQKERTSAFQQQQKNGLRSLYKCNRCKMREKKISSAKQTQNERQKKR